MSIVMAGLSPHPPIIIPEVGGKRTKEVKQTIDKLEELAAEVKSKEADILITISPHGSVFADAISVLAEEELTGDLEDFGVNNLQLNVRNNLNFVEKLTMKAEKNNIDIVEITSNLGRYNVTTKLDHGVIVPLYFLQKQNIELPLVPITIGMLDYSTLYETGKIIYETLEDMNLKGIIITSGDLSHRLKPGAPAGFNPMGEKFDKKVVNLLEEGNLKEILNIDKKLIEKAGECGLRPLIILLGALDKVNVKIEVKSYEGPFGVGYAVVGFYPEEG